jgi:site-specific recombinase XerD
VVRTSIETSFAAPKPKSAATVERYLSILAHLKTESPAWDLRARALLATAYCTMARRAQLVALRMEDLSFNPESGDGVALIRNTKAGREESRYLSREAVT